MNSFDFGAWLHAVRLTHAEAAGALGISEDYVSMLVADPGSQRYRRPSAALQQRCIEVARQRVAEIEPFTQGDP